MEPREKTSPADQVKGGKLRRVKLSVREENAEDLSAVTCRLQDNDAISKSRLSSAPGGELNLWVVYDSRKISDGQLLKEAVGNDRDKLKLEDPVDVVPLSKTSLMQLKFFTYIERLQNRKPSRLIDKGVDCPPSRYERRFRDSLQ